jgi:hypothetical protein
MQFKKMVSPTVVKPVQMVILKVVVAAVILVVDATVKTGFLRQLRSLHSRE